QFAIEPEVAQAGSACEHMPLHRLDEVLVHAASSCKEACHAILCDGIVVDGCLQKEMCRRSLVFFDADPIEEHDCILDFCRDCIIASGPADPFGSELVVLAD